MKRHLELAGETKSTLSMRQRCQILGICRSRLYYKPMDKTDDSIVNLMNEIREIYGKWPFQGYKRITDDLKDMGYAINHKTDLSADETDGS